MSGLLINLAVIRDAEPGTTLHYRFVDDGRVRDHTLGGRAADRRHQRRRTRATTRCASTAAEDGGEETILWVVEGVPTPIRILQREDGEDANDLRLIEYKGAAQ